MEDMDKKRQPIGVFDSGAGGLSVLKELVRLMPEEDFIYYGDSLNAPYGVKPLEQVRELTYACAEHLLGSQREGDCHCLQYGNECGMPHYARNVPGASACRRGTGGKASRRASSGGKGGSDGNAADAS